MTLPLRKPKRKLEGEEVEEESEKKSTENGENGETPAETAENGDSKEESADASDEAKPPIIKKPRRDIAEAAANVVVMDTATTEEGNEPKEDSKEEAPKEGETEKADLPPTEDTTEAKPPADETTAKLPAQDDAAKAPSEENADTKIKTEEAAAPAPALDPDVKEPDHPADEVTDTTTPAAKETPARSASPVPAPAEPIYREEEYEEPDDGAEIPEDPDHVWNARLVELLLYKHQYRTLHVQATYDQHLHAWVDIQRKLYRRLKKDPKSVSHLTHTRLNVLDAINFPFTLRGAAHWDRYYAKLQDFNRKHGHCLVPRLCEFPGLGDWVIDQRRQYKLMMQGKPSVLDPERQRKLEELGFVWVVRNRPEWNNRFSELLIYRQKYGDTKVPQHYKEIPGLGKWVAKQREQFRLLQQGKHSFLTPDRLEKLNDAGFVWSVRKDGTEDLVSLAGSGTGSGSGTKKKASKKEDSADKDREEEEKPGELPKLKEDGADKGKEEVVDSKEKKTDENDEEKPEVQGGVVKV